MKNLFLPGSVFLVSGFLFYTLLLNTQSFAQDANQSKNQCVNCHVEMEILPEDYIETDVHMHAELSCEGCHGGDPSKEDADESMSPKNGFVGIPAKKDIPKFCGKCHSDITKMRQFQPRISVDQVTQYYTSLHGEKLKAGDTNVADCVSCHTAHGIHSAKDPRSTVYPINLPGTCNKCHGNHEMMQTYNLVSNQYELYSISVHGKALLEDKDIGSPACNDCHGNHGAAPPGVQSLSHVCGTCHVNNMEYFNSSSMAEVFEDMEMHGCEQCHGYHDIEKPNDEMISVENNSSCTDCHEKGDSGYESSEKIRGYLKTLSAANDTANTKLLEVRMKGMNDLEIEYLLKESKQNLIKSKTLVHTFDPQKVEETAGEGINKAKEALSLADAEINEYYTRRNGFGIATIIFILLAIGVYFKIRDMN